MNLKTEIINNVKRALSEDVGVGDSTALLIPSNQIAIASIISREDAVLCGIRWFETCFQQLSPETKVQWFSSDGEIIHAGQELCRIKGNARTLLTAERSALNFLQTLSAVSTKTRCYVNAISGTNATIVDTRKTIPGLRLAQKYAVKCGGGANHRFGLYDGILIKENHIMATGNIEKILRVAEKTTSTDSFIQIEVETLDELHAAINAGANMILLDNFNLDELRYSVAFTAQLTNRKVILEASGGVTLENVRAIAETGVHRISIGALTKDIRAVDLSMRFTFLSD